MDIILTEVTSKISMRFGNENRFFYLKKRREKIPMQTLTNASIVINIYFSAAWHAFVIVKYLD